MIFNTKLYASDPRSYALDLQDLGITPRTLLNMALDWLTPDDVREMLDANGLSPRFDPDYDEEKAHENS